MTLIILILLAIQLTLLRQSILMHPSASVVLIKFEKFLVSETKLFFNYLKKKVKSSIIK